MGSHVVEDKLSSIPKKVKKVKRKSSLVFPPCVPRKLRSAISKRKSMSSSDPLLDSKRLKHSINGGVESAGEENGCSGYSSKLAESMAFSKEEEEVAEALFALAGMIPLKGESSKAKTTDLEKSPKILKKEPVSASHASSIGATNAVPAAQGSTRDSMKEGSLIETPIFIGPQLQETRLLNANLEISAPAVHLQSIPPLLRACNEKQLLNSSTLCQLSAESSWQSGSKETKQDGTLHPEGQSRSISGAVDVVANRESEHTTSDRRDNGSTLRSLDSSGGNGCPLQSSAVVFPMWPNTVPSSSRLLSHGDTGLLDKGSVSTNGSWKSWKKCATHVYLSRLIHSRQTSEGKDMRLDACQLQSSQYSSVLPDLNRMNGDLVTSRMFGAAAYMNTCETGNRVSMKVEKEDKEVGPSSSILGGSKQGFDFLSLPNGAGPEANNGTDNLGNYVESKDWAPHIQSTARANASLPCSSAHTRFPSCTYRDQVAVASMALPSVPSQVHGPLYLPNPFVLTHMSGSAKLMEQSHPKSQQQQIWPQLAAQLRPGQLHSSQITTWQNRMQDPLSSTHDMQLHLPPPQASLDVMGAKYLHLPQQQQRLVGACPGLPFSNTQPQIGQHPPEFDDKGGRFCANGTLTAAIQQ